MVSVCNRDDFQIAKPVSESMQMCAFAMFSPIMSGDCW